MQGGLNWGVQGVHGNYFIQINYEIMNKKNKKMNFFINKLNK